MLLTKSIAAKLTFILNGTRTNPFHNFFFSQIDCACCVAYNTIVLVSTGAIGDAVPLAVPLAGTAFNVNTA